VQFSAVRRVDLLPICSPRVLDTAPRTVPPSGAFVMFVTIRHAGLLLARSSTGTDMLRLTYVDGIFGTHNGTSATGITGLFRDDRLEAATTESPNVMTRR